MNGPVLKKSFSITHVILILSLIAIWLLLRFLFNPAGSGKFDRYHGPVLPLTCLNGAEGINVQRHVSFDFSPYQQETNQGVTNFITIARRAVPVQRALFRR